MTETLTIATMNREQLEALAAEVALDVDSIEGSGKEGSVTVSDLRDAFRKLDPSPEALYLRRLILNIRSQCEVRFIEGERVAAFMEFLATSDAMGSPIEDLNAGQAIRLQRELPRFFEKFLEGRKRDGGPREATGVETLRTVAGIGMDFATADAD